MLNILSFYAESPVQLAPFLWPALYVFLTMQLQHTLEARRVGGEGRGYWFWVLEIALELQPTHFSLLTQFSIYAF